MRELTLAAYVFTTALLSANAQPAATQPLPEVSQVFSIEKGKPGTLAVINVKVTNHGRSVYMLNTTGLPSQPVCSGYRVAVLRGPTPNAPKQGMLESICHLNGKLLQVPIAPGATYLQKIELSLYIDLEGKGDYSIEISHPLTPLESYSDSTTILNFYVD